MKHAAAPAGRPDPRLDAGRRAALLALLTLVLTLSALAIASPSSHAGTLIGPQCIIGSQDELLTGCRAAPFYEDATRVGPVKAVDGAGPHACVVKTTGAVFCFGEADYYGQIQAPTGWNYLWWRNLPTAATDVTSGRWHGCALAGAGTVSCWGSNWHGQRGDGTTKPGYAVQVKGLPVSGVSAVDAGDFHTCAVLTDHTVRCWGDGREGQLGNGGTTDALTATPVPGISDAVDVSAGAFHTCAVRSDGHVACWGTNDHGQLGDGTTTDRLSPTEVPGLADAVAVSAGRTHTCAIRADHTVVCWGTGLVGQLGLGADVTRTLTPTPVPSVHDATELLTTAKQTCARADGDRVWCWGTPTHGTGPSALTARIAMVKGLDDATSIVDNDGSTFCARRAAGAAACWGDGGPELGAPAPEPLRGIADASSVAARGRDGICVVRTGGTVDCRRNDANDEPTAYQWGPPASPLTGVKAIADRCLVYTDGRAACYASGTSIRTLPTDDVGGIGDAVAVSGSSPASYLGGTCFLRANGRVLCLGSSSNSPIVGAAGDTSQHPLVAGLDDAIDVSVGGIYPIACAVRANGTVRCWGGNDADSLVLGDGVTRTSATPIAVPGITDARTVTVGGNNVCVVRANGHVSCWGADGAGQLGDGGGPATGTPHDVPGVTDAVAVAVGGTAICALRTDHTVQCWGSGAAGQFGDGFAPSGHFRANVTPTLTPLPVMHNVVPPRIVGPVVNGQRVLCDPGIWRVDNRIAGAPDDAFAGDALSYRFSFTDENALWTVPSPPGDYRTATADDGTSGISCWAGATNGGARASMASAKVDASTNGTPTADPIAAGAAHACAVRTDHTAWCWGSNKYGQLGRGTVGDSATPVKVNGLSGVRSVAAGERHSCALLQDHTVRCWGYNQYGELGDGTTANQYKPVTVQGLTNAVQVTVGDRHTCALRADGTAACWGLGASGRLGNGSTVDHGAPVAVSGLANLIKISAGGRSSCAVRIDGRVFCWGAGDNGRLGNGSTASSSTPVLVSAGIYDAIDVAVGASHACLLRSYGIVRCWGSNAHGQLGDGTTTDATTPVQPFVVAGSIGAYEGPPAVQIAAGGDTSCARLGGGSVSCWGAAASHQLGGASTDDLKKSTLVPGIRDAAGLAVGPGRSCIARAFTGHAACWGDVADAPAERPELSLAS